MARKVLYIAIAVVVAVIALIVGLEVFSSYPNEAIVYNTEAPVQSVKSIIVHASAEKTWTIMSEVNKWETWESDNKSPVLKGAFEPGNSFTWKSNGLSIHSINPTGFYRKRSSSILNILVLEIFPYSFCIVG
jgi:hypothetical protein